MMVAKRRIFAVTKYERGMGKTYEVIALADSFRLAVECLKADFEVAVKEAKDRVDSFAEDENQFSTGFVSFINYIWNVVKMDVLEEVKNEMP